MGGQDWLAEQFETHRSRLRAIAYRMLGSGDEADDAVQEAWIRLSRTDSDAVENLGGWLTTVVARVALDMLRSRRSRREEPTGEQLDIESPATDDTPEEEAVLAESVGSALLVLLETLSPAERLAFVLHDTFAVPFDKVGAILDRSPNAAKQLAHRARQKVQGSDSVDDGDPARQRQLVEAFLAASRSGNFDDLLALLHPEVAIDADPAAVRMGSPTQVRGAAAVTETFSGRAQAAEPALMGGSVGMVWMVGGWAKVAWDFTIRDGKITHIEMIADPARLDELNPAVLDSGV